MSSAILPKGQARPVSSNEKPLPSTTDAEEDPRQLRRQLDALNREAIHNQAVMQRCQQREMAILNCESLADLLRLLTEDLRPSFQLPWLSLTLFDPDGGLRALLSAIGSGADEYPNLLIVESDDRLAATRGLHRPLLGPWHSDHVPLFASHAAARSTAVVPLKRNDRVIGSLNLASADAHRFTRHHATDFLARLGNIIAVCLENAINRETLRLNSMTDGLTGMLNRRFLDLRLPEEVARSIRYQQPLSCLFIDADHFKRVNDEWGHAAGDEVLKQIASRIRAQLRASDIATRYGGEEFAILLPQTTLDNATALAERIRQCVAATPIPIDGGRKLLLTLSIGVSQTRAGEWQDVAGQCRDLIDSADRAVYRAKEAGRNCVCRSL